MTASSRAKSRSATLPPAAVAADWTLPQRWEAYRPDDHAVWDRLFERQTRLLRGRVAEPFLAGLDALGLGTAGIPRLDALNERLFRATGWEVVAVPGLIPDDVFFRHLSHRRFPAGNFIRPMAQLDYLEAPDLFHDIFGHVPLLADRRMADCLQALGELGLGACRSGALDRLSRLYWHTIEFGLVDEDGALKIYGAGLASSFGEAIHALDSAEPARRRFDIGEAMATFYRSDRYQPLYFVVDSLESLLTELASVDLPGRLTEPLMAAE